MSLLKAEAMYFKVPSDGVEPQRSTTSRVLKVGIAIFCGSCLVLLGVVAKTADSHTLNSTSAESTSLIGLPTTMRSTMKKSPVQSMMMSNLRGLPGDGPWKELAIAGIEAANRCDRDVSMNAQKIKGIVANMDPQNRAMVARAQQMVIDKAEDLEAGIFAPLGFFDPLGISVNKPPGKLLFYREAELKHGRVCMLASLGFLVGEQFHPLFGGNIDVPSYIAFQETPLQKFWILVSVAIAIPEIIFSIPTFANPAPTETPTTNVGTYKDKDTWTMKEDGRIPGDLGWDPLGLKPTDPEALLDMQNKELAHARLAMISMAGMVAQELVTKEKLLDLR
jgi:hypothetical protein